MSRVSNSKWLCVWCAAVVCAAGAVVQAAQTLRVLPIIHNNEVLVSFEVPDGYTSDVREADARRVAVGLRSWAWLDSVMCLPCPPSPTVTIDCHV